jgi:hypothetical protein
MPVTAGLLALSLVVATPPAPAGLQKGDEFTFVGTVAEEVRRAPNFFRRNHKLELRVFVLDRQEAWADAVVLTRLQRAADAVAGAVGAVTGADADRDAPPLVRIDLVRVHTDGTVHLLAPTGPPPLKLTADTPARGLPALPLDSFAPFEFGVFPPRPPRNGNGEPWTVAASGNRPTETWQARESAFVNAERCQLLVVNQQSADWDNPVGGKTSWHRADAVWVSTRDGTARRVHRVIRQRDGRDEKPAAWVEVKYELKAQTRLDGRTFDRARHEAEVAYWALAEAGLLVPDAARLGPKTFETRLAKLDAHLEEADTSSAYREAMLAARRSLDDARRGKVAPVRPAGLTAPVPAHGKWPEAGDAAPDFTTGSFHLSDHRGKAVVLVFVRPGSETTDLALAVAGALDGRYAGAAVVVPLVVFGEVADAAKDRDRLKLTVPLYDGATVATLYGVETVPRFAVIDAAGQVRWEFAGVGAETGFLVKQQVDRLVTPASRNGAAGITLPAVPPKPRPLPRP